MPTSKEPKPIKVSKLGIGGVNLCKTPLKLDDNEVAQAQNAEPYTDRGRAGIRKRPALRPVNSVAVDAIQGLLSVELSQAGMGARGGLIAPPGPGNPVGDDDWTGISTDDAPDVIDPENVVFVPNDIPNGPVVLVALNGYPRNAAWKYTRDNGVTWVKTTALTNPIASDDVAPTPLGTPFALTIESPVSVTFTTGADNEIVTTSIGFSGFNLIPSTPGPLRVEFTMTITGDSPNNPGAGVVSILALEEPTPIAGAANVSDGVDFAMPIGPYVEEHFEGEAYAGIPATWAELQAITGLTLTVGANAFDNTPGTIVDLEFEITNATWRTD
jgi:hypothetical protein